MGAARAGTLGARSHCEYEHDNRNQRVHAVVRNLHVFNKWTPNMTKYQCTKCDEHTEHEQPTWSATFENGEPDAYNLIKINVTMHGPGLIPPPSSIERMLECVEFITAAYMNLDGREYVMGCVHHWVATN